MAALTKKKKQPDTITPTNPTRTAIALPRSRVPNMQSIVSFKFLLKNAIKFFPDEQNAEDVKLRTLSKLKFKNGAKGIQASTVTDLPNYQKPHVYKQVIRCTPAGYTGKVVDCQAIVFNCSCPRFTFTWNWVLWSKHASVLNAINSSPDITNPQRHIGSCKHGIVVMRAVKARGM